jgi:hypothetical protein
MRPRVLECSQCGGPVRFRAAFCAYCRSPLVWDAAPLIERGGLLFSTRYESGPEEAHLVASPSARADGGLVTVTGLYRSIDMEVQVRDSATSVEAAALDRAGEISVVVRAFDDGPLFSCYAASIVPAFRRLHLARVIEGAGFSTSDVLAEWQICSAVRPTGELNHLELRIADSLLEVHVNGTCVLARVEEGIAFGASGFRLLTLENAARFFVKRLDVHAAFAVR